MIDLGVKVNSKEEAIDHLVDLMVKGGNITDREEYKKGILAREANGTTGIGGGIAIPHSKNKAVTKAGLAGALSMAFKCGLPAPHGGIFVIGVITNPVQYLISVAVGAVIGMIVMSFTKKPLNK